MTLPLGVELLVAGARVGVDCGGAFGFVEGVAALVLFPHPVHNEHHQEDGAQKAHHGTTDHGWKRIIQS